MFEDQGELFTPTELADQLHLSTSTLAQWRYKGTGPKFIKVGRKVLYRAADIHAWFNAGTHQGTAEVNRVA